MVDENVDAYTGHDGGEEIIETEVDELDVNEIPSDDDDIVAEDETPQDTEAIESALKATESDEQQEASTDETEAKTEAETEGGDLVGFGAVSRRGAETEVREFPAHQELEALSPPPARRGTADDGHGEVGDAATRFGRRAERVALDVARIDASPQFPGQGKPAPFLAQPRLDGELGRDGETATVHIAIEPARERAQGKV